MLELQRNDWFLGITVLGTRKAFSMRELILYSFDNVDRSPKFFNLRLRRSKQCNVLFLGNTVFGACKVLPCANFTL